MPELGSGNQMLRFYTVDYLGSREYSIGNLILQIQAKCKVETSWSEQGRLLMYLFSASHVPWALPTKSDLVLTPVQWKSLYYPSLIR